MKNSRSISIKDAVIIIAIILLGIFVSSSIIIHMEDKSSTINYALVPLKNTENNIAFYLYPNNNGTYTYYYVAYNSNGSENAYIRGIIEENASLIIKPNYSVNPYMEQCIRRINGKKYISYTIYAPLDNIFGEFKLDSDAEDFRPTF